MREAWSAAWWAESSAAQLAASSAAAGTEVLPFGEGMTRPELHRRAAAPSTRREALEARVEGVMLVKCVITTEGKLDNCRIIKPLPHMEKAVLEALATRRYTAGHVPGAGGGGRLRLHHPAW